MNTNEKTQLFHKNFMKAYNTHAPIKILSSKATKTKLKPWLTKGILKSIKVKRKYLSQYNTSKDPQCLIHFKVYRQKIKKLINISRRSYYEKLFLENANHIKKLGDK